jgi:DNA-binding NarL/FixJ family response regulator
LFRSLFISWRSHEMRICRPDGVVIDISLPGTKGIELIKNMRAEMPKLPILVVSMHEAELFALRALRAGALAYINKESKGLGQRAGNRCVGIARTTAPRRVRPKGRIMNPPQALPGSSELCLVGFIHPYEM